LRLHVEGKGRKTMAETDGPDDRVTKGLRWTARGIGTFVAVYWLAIGVISAVTGTDPWSWESTALTMLVLVNIVGVVLAWRWESIGSPVMVLGSIALGIFAYFSAGRNKVFASLISGGPFLLSGLLFLLSGWRTQGEKGT
jgi:hypothetical protein